MQLYLINSEIRNTNMDSVKKDLWSITVESIPTVFKRCQSNDELQRISILMRADELNLDTRKFEI